MVQKYITSILTKMCREKYTHSYLQITQNNFLFHSGGFWDNPDYLDSSSSANRLSSSLISFRYICAPRWIVDIQTLILWSWWTHDNRGGEDSTQTKAYHMDTWGEEAENHASKPGIEWISKYLEIQTTYKTRMNTSYWSKLTSNQWAPIWGVLMI